MRRHRAFIIVLFLATGVLGAGLDWLWAPDTPETAAGDGVGWWTDLEAAAVEARETGKPLFLDFTADWCPPCRRMEEDTWPDPRVRAALMGRFTPVQVDIDEQPEVAREHGVSVIPTLVVFDGEESADRVSGFMNPARLLVFLADRGAPQPAEPDG